MTWRQDPQPHHFSSKWRPLLSKLIIQDDSKTGDTLSPDCLGHHFPDNSRAIWSNFVKMEGFATSFYNFWQISSDKICTNWVAKFIIKGGGSNFVQIGVSCLRGPSMTIAVLGNKDYYHPSNVKFKITHLHFTQCPLSLPDCLILERDTGHLFSFGNKFLGNTSPSTATL